MTTTAPLDRPWADRVVTHARPQPDMRSCGAASLVMARMLADEGYAALLLDGTHPRTGVRVPGTLPDRLDAEVLAAHRQVTSARDGAGRPQPPWPRALGTPPWNLARALADRSARHVVRTTRTSPVGAQEAVGAALGAGRPVAWYVGTPWLPRHVVLVAGSRSGRWQVWDPAGGRVVEVPRAAVADGPFRLGRWDTSWFLVLPR
jgi:hypothetical protein